MSFPDIKLIIILFLSIVVFFMYKEIMNIKTKLNTLYLSHKNIKSNPNKEFIDEEFIDNINEIFQKNNEQFPNFSLSHNNDLPIFNNIFGGCIIKTISIPLDSHNHPDIIEMNPNIIEMNSNLTEMNPNIIEMNSNLTEMNPNIIEMNPNIIEMNSNIIEMNSNLTEMNSNIIEMNPNIIEMNSNIIEMNPDITEMNPDIIEMNPDIIEMNPDIIEMNNIIGEYTLIQEVKSEKYSAKLDQVDSEHIDSPYSGKILSEHIDSPYSGKILSEQKDILPNESTSNHTEIYSNDESITNSSVITSSIQQKTNNEKINDYNKMKLPEIQDLAISYKISLQNNNKKKTKTELITDIKKYLLNKNI